MREKTVAVVGAGLGGLSAAISLASEGFAVRVYEKNEKPGGKLNFLEKDGFSFDMGPSMYTLPQMFRQLFERAGKRQEDYYEIVAMRPHWRCFFDDGTHFDLAPERERLRAEVERIGAGADWENLERFLTYSKEQYEVVAKGYFDLGLDRFWELVRAYGFEARKLDLMRSMAGGVHAHLQNPKLRDVFDFFIKYVGSSAYNAPGFMNLMPNIQFEYDLWYVKGGMYNLARGLERLARDVGVEFEFGAEVLGLEKAGGRISGLRLADGRTLAADYVVSNMEVVPTYRDLLEEPKRFVEALERKYEPACSGLVIHLALDRVYENVAHHNFVFSGDQRKHFATVFDQKRLPEDPTLYMVAPTRTDPGQAPEGRDNIKILPHIPYLREDRPYTHEDYTALKERIFDKLERTILPGLREHILFEHLWTPFDLQKAYRSNRGSIYGVVSDRSRNYAFKAPKLSSRYSNLYFTGGSVNPGGGMPMVVLCGQKVADRIVAAEGGASRAG